jgi:beta-galactosidase GanA
MRNLLLSLSTVALVSIAAAPGVAQNPDGASQPHLEKRGAVTQLIVDGKPYLMLAGELNNSSSSSLQFMKPIWPKLAEVPLNTVLTPLSWELVEPAEGHYDFTLVDGLLDQARAQHLHIVFLWLASWKNGMSSYAPEYVKQDAKRFPRAVVQGEPSPILSTIAGVSDATRQADAHAFAAVMAHLKQVDSRDHTVLMMQVENEVGVLGDTRDHSEAANKAFAGPVPAELTRYLAAHKDALNPELRDLWEANGAKTSGTWPQVFGDSPRADEVFMAWNYARYVQAVTAAGKAAYDLPMYVNTWLGGKYATPGTYPSGGAQPRVMDVWKSAGTAIDVYAPDLYAPDFYDWANRYNRPDNPLWVPETRGGAAGAANVFYAVGEHAALGFSPFAIDAPYQAENAELKKQTKDPQIAEYLNGNDELGQSYKAIASIAPTVLEAETRGEVHGFTLDHERPSQEFQMGPYTVEVSLDEIFGSHSEKAYGLVLMTGSDPRAGTVDFLGAGRGFRVKVTSRKPGEHMGVGSIDEGTYADGTWVPGRRLNGDESDQGNYWRFDPRVVHVEKAQFYRFE